MKFQQKIGIIVFISIFLPCTVMSILTYSGAVDALTKQMISISKAHTETNLADIDNSLSAAVSINGHILKEDTLIEFTVHNTEFTVEEKARYYPELYQLFKYYISRIEAPNILRCLHSYYLYLPSQHTVITTDTTYYENIAESDMDFVRKLRVNGYLSGWYTTKPVTYESIRGADIDKKLISYVLPIYSDDAKTLVAVCALNISTSLFDNLYEDPVENVDNSTYVFDANGMIVDSDTKLDELTAEQQKQLFQNCTEETPDKNVEILIGNQKYYAVYSNSNFTGWKCVTLFNKNDITKQLTQTRVLMLIMLSVSVMLIFLISMMLARLFFTPLKKLTKAMEAVQSGNFKMHINDKRRDEYQLIYSGFNRMTDDLDQLVKNLGTEQLLNRESKIKLLQEQINPHFLYNTLDSIYSIARIQNVPEISSMVMALSKFFRASLSEGKDIVTLQESIELVESYLTVQNIRFKGKVGFEVQAPKELLDCLVPKLLLQPFIENSVHHGIEKIKEKGSLTVKAEKRENSLLLIISDNGIGITAEKLAQIKESIQNNSINEDGNFAIKNLNTQIKLRFGEEYGVTIDSTEGKGTRVMITLPVVHNREELEKASILPIQ